MKSVLTHIVHKHLSNQFENVATEALTFIVSSEAARSGLMSLLCTIEPDLPPDLRFETQKSEGSSRPDMRGVDGNTPRVFIENKFWAGLTDSQPVDYLSKLAEHGEPAVLLMVGPKARQEIIWREMCRRLGPDDPTQRGETDLPVGISGIWRTELGPTLALTSWTYLLGEIEAKVKDEPRSRDDLNQLQALCVSADSQAFIPLSAAELTDQRIPALVLEAMSVIEAAVQVCVSERVLSLQDLRPQSGHKRMGRYVQFLVSGMNPCPWIGVDLDLWRRYGETPVWLAFSSQSGRSQTVQPILEPWAARQGLPTGTKDAVFPFALGIHLAAGEEKDEVVRSVVKSIREIAAELARSPAQ